MIKALPDRSSVITGNNNEVPGVAKLDSRDVFARTVQSPNLGSFSSSLFSTEHYVSVGFELELVGVRNRGSSVRRPDDSRAGLVDDAECEESDGILRGYEAETEV